MLEISENDILNRMRRDNPWWETGTEKILEKDFPKRDYFSAFYHLVSQRDIRRAVVLMGPRQVGKTVMAKQAILELLHAKKIPNHIFFSSLDTPIMIGQNLEKVLRLYLDNFGEEEAGAWVFFDEVQYLKDWEVHLKSLVDSYPQIKFVVTGSAAAVLKRKSQESGAGRFSDFILPPLTFREFKRFKGLDIFSEIEKVNKIFLEYLAYGGYPELTQKSEAPKNFDQYLKSDVLDKVLLRDLPSLYGISDIQEMNRLFASLVFNTGQEISLESLSQKSDVSKSTLKKYIEYFEGAFLIKCLYRIDDNARHFKRARTFKVYVVNPAMYSALFGAPKVDDPKMGALAETAVIAQAFNASSDDVAHYARWKDGEVDLVYLDRLTQQPKQAIEVKWSDRISSDVRLAKNIAEFAKKNKLPNTSIITTRTINGHMTHMGEDILILPTASFCELIASNAFTALNEKVGLDDISAKIIVNL
jgi:predicted AAA+ superfamily ATPase